MQQAVVKVGDWLVTPSVNQIARDGRQLILEPRLIDLLLYFTHHPDVVLSRDELIENVWTRNIVTNHVVTQCVSELRKSLKDGEEASPEYIITVPKRGYKLTAAVKWLTDEEKKGPLPNIHFQNLSWLRLRRVYLTRHRNGSRHHYARNYYVVACGYGCCSFLR